MTDMILTKADDTLNIANEFVGLVVGRSGNDTITGGSSNDVIYGDNNSGGGVSVPRPHGYEIIEDKAATITFQGESAGYQNTFGIYKVDKDGNFTSVQVVFPNASLKGSGGELIAGRSFVNLDLAAGEQIGFFIAPNGFAKTGAAMNRTDGTWEFRDSAGQKASTRSGSDISLWFVPADGSAAIQVQTEKGKLFFSRDSLNHDNISHVRTVADEKTGIVKIGFEDLLGGGDKDFDDVQFSIDVGVNNVASFPSTKVFSEVASDDTLRGGAGNDTIYGGSGKDKLYGGTEDDKLFGGSGDDQLWGEDGNDTIDGGGANDRMWGGKGDDVMAGGAGHDQLSGEAGNDTLNGGAGDDQFWDGDGNDIVNGGSGVDFVRVGRGNDTLNGGQGFDTIDFGGATSAMTINLAARTASGGSLGDDAVRGFDRIIASKYNDTITGGSAVETIEAGAGKDIIAGGRGNDILWGGADADTFVWAGRGDINSKTTGRSVDTIKDFNVGADVLDVSALVATAKGDKALLFQTDETATGTMLKVNLGVKNGGWFDVAFLEGVLLGDQAGIEAKWLDVVV
jgi:serralysin